MKSIEQEKLRKILQSISISLQAIGSINFSVSSDSTSALITMIAGTSYLADMLLSNRYTKMSSDYKEVKDIYEQIIRRTVSLMEEFNIETPEQIASAYVYLYRNGYLSHNKHFQYNFRMKDLPHLLGVDVIRGKGVCRSIASMLTDIYKEYRYESYNLTVKTNSEIASIIKERSINEKLDVSKTSAKVAKKVVNLTKVLPVANHLITIVRDENNNFIFDPTADSMLFLKGFKPIGLPEDDLKNIKINYTTALMNQILGVIDTIDISTMISTCNNMKKSQIKIDPENAYENYKLSNQYIHDTFEENKDVLDYFYNSNKQLYEDLTNKSNEMSSYIKRMIPIIPKRK